MFSFVNNIHNSFVNPELINNVQRNGVLYMQYFANDLSSTAEQYFLNMHISDICTNDLQSNNFLSWKLQEKISVQQRYLYGCRPLYHFNNWNFPLHNSVKKPPKKQTKKHKTEPIYFFVLSYQVDCFCNNLGRERINI